MNTDRHILHSVVRVVGAEKTSQQEDAIAIEEPLEIRVAGEPVATTMRTPGEDRALALGFLFGEGIVSNVTEIGRIVHCGRLGTEAFENTIDVSPAPGVVLDPERLRAMHRGTLISASCGVCGRERIDDLRRRCQPLPDGPTISSSVIVEALRDLKDHQPTFALTGGVHGISVCDPNGNLVVSSEDVGRHNAVDKVIGSLVFKGWPVNYQETGVPTILLVSGRASFEIVQKAAVGRFPVVVAVSAPTSMAVALAEELNMTLLGFARNNRYNIYTGEARMR